MTEPELSEDETRTLIDYARRKFAEERWPMSPALRPVRAVMGREKSIQNWSLLISAGAP
jgi:hypothetical protein